MVAGMEAGAVTRVSAPRSHESADGRAVKGKGESGRWKGTQRDSGKDGKVKRHNLPGR